MSPTPQRSSPDRVQDSLADPTRHGAATLAALTGQVGALKTRVAGDFMALAAVLQANSRRAREITTLSRKATGAETSASSASPDTPDKPNLPIALLQSLLADSAGVTAMVDTSTHTIAQILAQVRAVAPPLQKLTQMSTLLQLVSVLCRIEGGRIVSSQVEIDALSHDIDKLATEVEQHIHGIQDDSETLTALLHSGAGELGRFGRQERLAAHDLIARTQAMLTPALARAAASRAATRIIDEQYTAFHRATDKVVLSLQSEDLARQRIEHVQDALERSARQLHAGEPASACARTLQLQRAQLVSTRDLLTASIETIRSGLQSLIPRVQELAAQTSTLARRTADDGRALVTLIDSELGTVTEVFRQCSASAAAVVSIVSGVLPSVEKMTGRARALEDIEISIRLISMNATVKTSQLGTEGAAMGVLASELHGITRNGGEDTRLVLAGLLAIRQELATITASQAATERSSILDGGSAEAVGGSLAGLSQTVADASKEVAAALEEVGRLAASLCAQLAQGLEIAARAATLARVFEEIFETFDLLFQQLGITQSPSAPADAAHASPHSSEAPDHENSADAPTEDIVALYSMQSERALHTQIFGGSAPSTPPPPTQENEFGADIELF